jgi:hypothetical protein
MRIAKLGELAAIALVAAICLCYAMISRAQLPNSDPVADGARAVTHCHGTTG